MQITANLIGVRVSWRVSDYMGERATVEQAIRDVGLNPDYLPRNSLKKAVGRASKAIAKADNGRFVDNLPTRKITDNADKAVYAIVRETVDQETEHADYQQATTVRLDKAEKRVHAVGAQADEFMTQFNAFNAGLTDEDIRGFANAIVKASMGIAFNPHGHDYFVPEAYQHNMEKLDVFLRNLNVGRMYITPAIDDTRSLECTWERASEEIDDEITLVMRSVDKFTSRVKCLHDKTEKLDALREMVKLYGSLTERSAAAEEMMAKLNTASDTIAAKIEEINASR
jgi:hypothetical protein